MNQTIKGEIEINAYRFINKPAFCSVPRIITVAGHRYDFVDAGWRFLVRRGRHLIKLFELSDGQHLIRLRLENGRWSLVKIQELV